MTKLPVSFRNIVSHEKQLPDWLKLTVVRAGLIGDANTDQRDFLYFSFFLTCVSRLTVKDMVLSPKTHGPINRPQIVHGDQTPLTAVT